MNPVLRLARANLREHPGRLLLTALATAAAAALVVWVVSGYDALLATFDEYSELALGRYELSAAPISHFSQYAPGAIPAAAEKSVPPELVGRLRADPAVAAADPMWAFRAELLPDRVLGAPAPSGRRLPDVRLIGTAAAAAPFPLAAGRWIDPAGTKAECVMSVSAAEAYGVGVGGHVIAGDGGRARRLEVVGLLDAPDVAGWSAGVARNQLLTPGVGGLFLASDQAAAISGRAPQVSFVGVAMQPGADVHAFRYAWSPRLAAATPPLQFQEAHDLEEQLDESASAENMALQAQVATAVSLLAALFIVFGTLSMGVTERTRQLALLRAVALTRAQVAALVVLEALAIGGIGSICGILAGRAALQLAVARAPALLEDGARVGPWSIGLAIACALGGALGASLLPAWRAGRVHPLDAAAPRPARRPWLHSPAAAVAGLLLLAVYPLLALILPHADGGPIRLCHFLGLGTLAVGCLLLIPAACLLVQRLAAPPLARLLRLPRHLLAGGLGPTPGRSAATATALGVGLGLFIAIMVWGHTMMQAFLPGRWAPDAVIAFKPHGIPFEAAQRVAAIPGVTRAAPLVAEQPRLARDLTDSATRATVTRQDNVVIVGVEPRQLLGPDSPFDFAFTQGDPASALAHLTGTRTCLVPDHFLTETGLEVGDSFEMIPPERPEQPVRYEIAGAVRLPGWHWQTKPTGFRTRTHRAAALVFAPLDSVRADFGFAAASHVWLDFDPAATDPETIRAAAQAILQAEPGPAPPNAAGLPEEAREAALFTADRIRAMVRDHAAGWLWGLSRLPIAILAISILGVLNALLASVRARRWEFGVLRAMGFSRGALVRLVLAEGLLLGLVACLASLLFGILAGWCGAGISRFASFFGGMPIVLTIPWLEVGLGLSAALLVATLAAAWPALAVGRSETLHLLRQGRGAE